MHFFVGLSNITLVLGYLTKEREGSQLSEVSEMLTEKQRKTMWKLRQWINFEIKKYGNPEKGGWINISMMNRSEDTSLNLTPKIRQVIVGIYKRKWRQARFSCSWSSKTGYIWFLSLHR